MFCAKNRLCASCAGSERAYPEGTSFIARWVASSKVDIAVRRFRYRSDAGTAPNVQLSLPIGHAILMIYEKCPMRSVAVSGIGKTSFGAFADGDVRSVPV